MNSILPLLRSALMPLAPWRTFVLVTALASVAVTGSACAQNTDPVIARVNGVEIRSSDLAIAEEEVGTNLPPMTAEGKRDYLVAYVSDMMLAAKAAEDKKMGDDADFKRRLT